MNANKLFSLILTKETIKLSSKPERGLDNKEVTYTNKHWKLFWQLRQRARKIIKLLELRQIHAIVHGSIARGDINKNSDIDIFIPNPPSSFLIETTLEQAKVRNSARIIIQATPVYAMKAYIEIDMATSLSFPLMSLRRVEREFYRFSGEVNLAQLEANARVAGVDKRLMLIEPTRAGHVESGIMGREDEISKSLGITIETMMDRVHALTKRDAVGRTGVFVKKELKRDETFELALKHLADENPAVRRRLKTK